MRPGRARPGTLRAHAGGAPLGGRATQLLVLDLALELLERAPQMAAHGGRRELLGDPPERPRARDSVGEPKFDVGACGAVAGVAFAQAPAAALVDPGDAVPRHVAVL